LFVNFKSPDPIPDFKLLNGNYTDFNPDWYQNIGGTLSFTFFLNTFTPHASKLFLAFMLIFWRFLDRGCRSSLKKN
jgi:hypothetical protein